MKKLGTEGSEGGSIEEEQEANQNIVIILPEIVRNFSEGKIDEDQSDFFLNILSGWYCKQLHEIYVLNEDIAFSDKRQTKHRNELVRKFETIEENMNLFIIRMEEKFLKDKYTPEMNIEKLQKIRSNDNENTSDSSSLTEQEDVLMAEKMFDENYQD